MFALPGLLLLLVVDWLRPQEHYPLLRGLPVLHGATALAVFGFVLDLKLGFSRLRSAPHLVMTLLFFAWCAVTVAVRAPEDLGQRVSSLIIPLAVYLLVAHALQSFRALETVAAAVLAIALALSTIAVGQSFAPLECHRQAMMEANLVLISDGRPCESRRSCEGEGSEPGAHYACERPGLLGTSTIGGRVRYRGTLGDPNELALVVGIALPLAFAFFDRRRAPLRTLLLAVAVVLVGLCAFYTQSRSGQLVFLVVLGIYLVQRVGWRWGLLVGTSLALPSAILGGRSGAEAAQSTIERIECWWVGLHLLQRFPLFGVGSGQFGEHHHLTAHNSLVLAAAELGVPGLLLWSSIVWISIKIPGQALRSRIEPVGRAWALALLASMAGLVVGAMFLSFAYKNAFWVYVGLTGVLHQAIARHDPSFVVRFGIRDLGLAALAAGVAVVSLVGYTGAKMGW